SVVRRTTDRAGSEPARSVVLRTTEAPAFWAPNLPEGAGRYRALFPRGWFEYDLPGWPVRVAEEQLAPMIPGDEASASLPAGAFEYRIDNIGNEEIDVAVLLSWRDEMRASLGDQAGTFAIAAAEDGADVSSCTFDPGDAADVWSAFAAGGGLPTPELDRVGAVAVVARAHVMPGASASLRFAVAWDVPYVEFGAGRRWPKRYTREWGTSGDRAADIAAHALSCQPSWREAIEAWQAPILDSTNRPDWYKAALFNELYFLLDGGSFWPDVRAVDDGPPPLAELGILECYDYPFYDTLDVHFYAAFALSALWPQLQASISRGYARAVAIDDPAEVTIEASGERAVRKAPAALPHDLGGPGEDPLVRVNHYRFQEVNGWKDLNPKFVLQAWRDRLFAGDQGAYLRDVWPAIGPAMDRLAGFDRDGDGLPEHDGRPDQTYDTWPMSGPSAYGGSLWLAALRAAASFARAVGDQERAAGWERDFERGRAALDARLWNGRSFDFDAGGGTTSDSVMADQLVGQWYADVCGLGDLVPPDRVRSSLERVFELNVCGFADGRMGAVNGMRPDGSVDASSEQSQEVWVGTTYALAAFMIGRGLVEEGWSTAEGVARVVWERGLWFRTPEAFDLEGNFRASLYLRPLAIWAIEDALSRTVASPEPAANHSSGDCCETPHPDSRPNISPGTGSP
ncbi:MAG TPA: non-lysosomal glucosylceramidase, partial [Vitreimonas sp.]|nr:non-lysosomal glucosylceramidase [Vitreimonas sp.]